MPAAKETIEQARQRDNLALLQSGEEVAFGSEQGLPWTPTELAALRGDEPCVVRKLDSGLTAFVYELDAEGRRFALKQARPECLVRNVDGQTSFLNEILCRQHIEALRDERTGRLAAVTKTHVASLRHGVLLTEWVDGEPIRTWDRRRLESLFAAGCDLLLAGLFEWDYCTGNLLDDGTRIRLFDFGYTYPFDPLRHFNSAGNGDGAPLFHLAERFETRNYFAYLLDLEAAHGIEAALAAFRLEKEIATEAYIALRHALRQRGATPVILDWLQACIAAWSAALETDLMPLYWKEGWRSHMLDLDDDLRGQTCTPMTLRRGEWLLQALEQHYTELDAMEAFFWHDAGQTRQQLLDRYRAHLESARRLQIR